MITVGATVLGLVPLAMHGGPLWEPLCYAQIGGLTLATFITLLLVPVMYSIFVRDLKLIRWDVRAPETQLETAMERFRKAILLNRNQQRISRHVTATDSTASE